ncbi:phosphoglycerate dehydrogenase-like enzyme [Devosia sp. UYZn731]|uniref:D-2-hydroxyacid dehydrogenase n=1 Tax=Devosia sp. UYZn731 TaxID=3156345 RepID=UPI003393AB38
MTEPTEMLFIATPLETEYVDRIKAAAGDRIRVVYDADLMPPTRFVADHGGMPGFRRNEEQASRWAKHLAAATILFDMPPGIPAGSGLLDVAPNVKWVQTSSSGIGQALKRLGLIGTSVHVTNARGIHAEPLAEFAFASILKHVKRLDFLRDEQAAHRWERYCGDGLDGTSLLVVGAGAVGSRVGRLGQAFGMTVAAVVNSPSPERKAELNAHSIHGVQELHGLLSTADFVVLCVPHTPDTEQLINAKAIAAMKPGVVLVNIARGQVIDEEAMIGALRSGHIAFAGLDVAAIEPLPVESPLWDMPNVLISPHSASTVTSENRRITDIFCANIPLYLDGRLADMKNVFDKDRMY